MLNILIIGAYFLTIPLNIAFNQVGLSDELDLVARILEYIGITILFLDIFVNLNTQVFV